MLPNEAIPNSFFAQAGDLEDVWGPAVGPCFAGFSTQWNCCDKGQYQANRSSATCMAGTHGQPQICDPACAAAAGTPTEGGIHPRSKRPVGERLATAAFNTVYGGDGANTGPTLAGCTLTATSITILFNTTLLAGEKVALHTYNSSLNNEVAPPPPVVTKNLPCFEETKALCGKYMHNISDCRSCKDDPAIWAKLQPVCGSRPINNFHDSCESFFPAKLPLRGSLLEVLVGSGKGAADAFCIEPQPKPNGSYPGELYCPPWAGGSPSATYDGSAAKWFTVDIVSATANSVTVDLSKLNGLLSSFFCALLQFLGLFFFASCLVRGSFFGLYMFFGGHWKRWK